MTGTCAPCPICFSHNLHVAEWYDPDGTPAYRMVCDDCGYEDPDMFEEEYVAVDHWNRRVVKGYIDGMDPTDTMYDKLEEDDWDEPAHRSEVGDISWDIPVRHSLVEEPKKHRR